MRSEADVHCALPFKLLFFAGRRLIAGGGQPGAELWGIGWRFCTGVDYRPLFAAATVRKICAQ
jgi:hypothetical protein